MAMKLLGRIARAPGDVLRFFKLYGQHLPRAFPAIFGMRCQVTLLCGTLTGSDERVTVLYVGRGMNYHYLLRIIFADHRVTAHKASNLLAFRKHILAMEDSADVLLIDVGWPYNGLFHRQGSYLEVPDWVNMAIEFPEHWDEVVANFRRSARKHDLRLIRRNGYQCRAAGTREEVEAFYKEMYMPFVKHRHLDESLTAPMRHVIKRGLQGTLLHILRGNEIVSAGIIYPEDDVMFSLWMGIPREHLEAQPEAAVSALYFFGIRYAFDAGYGCFDFTGTRAFLKDGAYQFKRRWGPALDDAFSPGSVLIRPKSGNRKAALFCQQVPVLSRVDEGLEALFVCTDGQADEALFARLDKDFGCAGFDRLRVIEISSENETKSMPNGQAGCQYQLVRCTLERFAEVYANS